MVAALIHPGTKGQGSRVVDMVKETSGLGTYLLHTSKVWKRNLRETLIELPKIVEAVQACKAEFDMTVLGVDAAYKSLFGVLDQRKHGKRKVSSERPSKDIHAMVSVASSDGINHVDQKYPESPKHLLEVLDNVVAPQGRRVTRAITCDSPWALDQKKTYKQFTKLECVMSDLIHPALRIELATGEKLTPLSKAVRICLFKMTVGFDDG